MKKIISLILLLIGLYIISIFLFPSISSSIWEKIWLTWFNESVIKVKKDFDDFIMNFDVIWKYKETKDSALELKQNVETQVQETKKQIEVIQTNVDKTTKAIDDTSKAVNNTVNSLNDLTKSIKDVVPTSSSWSSN